MKDWQKTYNAFFNSLAVQAIGKPIYCKNCGCEFYDHRYWYYKSRDKTECHGCQDCTWFEPMGMTMEKLIPVLGEKI